MIQPDTRRCVELVWAALWRAETVHLGLFVGVPALLGLLKSLLGIVFLPFLLLSFGDTHRQTRASHLGEAACWVALAPCSVAEAEFIALPVLARAASEKPPDLAPRGPLGELPTALTLRHLWFMLWLSWFVLFLVVRERRERREHESR